MNEKHSKKQLIPTVYGELLLILFSMFILIIISYVSHLLLIDILFFYQISHSFLYIFVFYLLVGKIFSIEHYSYSFISIFNIFHSFSVEQ